MRQLELCTHNEVSRHDGVKVCVPSNSADDGGAARVSGRYPQFVHVSRVDKRLIEFLLATCSQLHVFLAWDHCTAFISLLSCPFLHCFHH